MRWKWPSVTLGNLTTQAGAACTKSCSWGHYGGPRTLGLQGAALRAPRPPSTTTTQAVASDNGLPWSLASGSPSGRAVRPLHLPRQLAWDTSSQSRQDRGRTPVSLSGEDSGAPSRLPSGLRTLATSRSRGRASSQHTSCWTASRQVPSERTWATGNSKRSGCLGRYRVSAACVSAPCEPGAGATAGRLL